MAGAVLEEQPHILVVDDDTRLRALLSRFLGENGFRVTTAENSAEARRQMRALAFDLLVLDIMMPGESGLSLTESLRAVGNVPIMLLTARGDPEDRIKGLEIGADDYLAKPFEPRELVARIRSVLRRAPPTTTSSEVWLGVHRYDLQREELLGPGGAVVRLTSAETRLMQVLAASPDKPITREELTRRSSSNLRTIDVQVTRLRRKIEPDPRLPRYLQTVRGQGYVLRPDNAPPQD